MIISVNIACRLHVTIILLPHRNDTFNRQIKMKLTDKRVTNDSNVWEVSGTYDKTKQQFRATRIEGDITDVDGLKTAIKSAIDSPVTTWRSARS